MKSTKTAWTVTAVVIVLCAVMGCNRSLAALRSETARMMVTGDAYGYCIATDCQDMVNVARNVITLTERYTPAPKRLPGDVTLEDYCIQMEKAGTDAKKRVETAQSIRVLAERTMVALEKEETLTERDRAYLAGFRADLASATARMEKDPYNDAARAFNAIQGSFPANVLGFWVGPLECFEF